MTLTFLATIDQTVMLAMAFIAVFVVVLFFPYFRMHYNWEKWQRATLPRA